MLAIGIGDGSPPALRKAGAALARKAKSAAALAVDLRSVALDPDGLRAFAEALLLASYGFSRKEKAEPRVLQTITLVVGKPKPLQPALDRAITVAGATAAARDLVNTPSLDKTPEWLAAAATTLLKGLTVKVRDEKELAKGGFGGIVAVGMGSTRPPRLIEASYDGGKRHVVLVGKGITFDTGGLSLKPNEGMLTMKTDMGGGAAVLGALRAAADLKLPLRVTALVAAAENMPSGTAQRPGDVIRQYGGTTVEVLNTDAEGRLVLADAIAYADRDLKADVIIDIATLTGAMPIALGKKIAGFFCNDDELAAELTAAADASGERAWRLPLVEDYRQALESPTADLRNIGQPTLKLGGGSITAALFLREFAGGRPWAHLDIAGPGRSDADDDELTKGGTGYGVRLLTRWLEALSVAGKRKAA
ncbi:MAG: Leucyl aminopeptidase [Frankiales bacterium]|nr:Leucyl aminopeptidase [Frankiales bacterium]